MSCDVRYTYKQIASALFHPTKESARADTFQGPECYFVGFFIAQQSSRGSEALLTSGPGGDKTWCQRKSRFFMYISLINKEETLTGTGQENIDKLHIIYN